MDSTHALHLVSVSSRASSQVSHYCVMHELVGQCISPHAMQLVAVSIQGESLAFTQVSDAQSGWAMQAGQLSQELRDKRAERAVARATANAYRQVCKTGIGCVLALA